MFSCFAEIIGERQKSRVHAVLWTTKYNHEFVHLRFVVVYLQFEAFFPFSHFRLAEVIFYQ